MATKKNKAPSENLGVHGPSNAALKKMLSVPEDLSPEEQELLDKARVLLGDIGKRMRAIVWAASEQWKPALQAHQVDETAEPYLSDEEFDDIVNVTELMAEMAYVRDLGLFFELPKEMMESVIQDRLRAKLVPTQNQKKSGPIVVYKHNRKSE